MFQELFFFFFFFFFFSKCIFFSMTFLSANGVNYLPDETPGTVATPSVRSGVINETSRQYG